jgi:outer membrane receptor protein involved in Fe transport
MYAGIEKKFAREQLKLNLTLRLDKNENFPYLLSPAASVVYRVGEDNYLRLSLSSAIRNPTLADQYLYYNVGRAILLGNIDGYKGLVTVPSLIRFYDLNKNFDSLFFFDVDPVRPEKVRTLELGFKGTVFRQLYVDVSGYYSRYKDFIGYKIGVATDTFTVSTPFAQYKDLTINNVYRVATNSKDAVTTMGAAIGLSYYIGRYLAVLGNYSWNVLDRQGSADPLIPAFNTPEHKFNIGFNGRDIHKFGFSINYKWVDGFVFEGSPQFTGRIDSYGLLDVQVNRQFPRDNAVLKIGASNILENKHYEVYGGPLIGRMIYVSFSFAMNGN